MALAADAVVFLTGVPVAGGLILDGFGGRRLGEIGAGLFVVILLGVPSLLIALRRHYREE